MKARIISGILTTMGVVMIAVAIVLQSNASLNYKEQSKTFTFSEVDVKSMAASTNMIVHEKGEEAAGSEAIKPLAIKAVEMETAPASVIIPPRVEVFEGMTLEELGVKLDRNLGNGYIAGKGILIANRCIELGVDPYMAVAIMLHETGCKYNCSSLVRNCNNVGGQKGYPSCSGAYKGYATLDEGIIGFVDNLYNNYYAKGYTTVAAIAPRYAQSPAWPGKINSYMASIRAN